MMKNLLISILILFISINHLCFGQIQSMGFKPANEYFFMRMGIPKLKLLDDNLYVCTQTGIYKKNLQSNADWELYAFENMPVIEFVKNGDKLLAITMYSAKDPQGNDYVKWGTENLLLLSTDNGQTFIDFTSQHFIENGNNTIFRIAQNPENPNSIIALHARLGISKTFDFGENWGLLIGSILRPLELVFHSLDTTIFFHTGESMNFQGTIWKFSDNGDGTVTWKVYVQPTGSNCVHNIAFHPTNPDILVYGGEGFFGKSIDKGETWNALDYWNTGMYFYKTLFDERAPDTLYSTGFHGSGAPTKDTIYVYRSTDMGDSWQLFHKEYVGEIHGEYLENCGFVIDMVKYKNKLFFYSLGGGLLKLQLDSTETYLISVSVNNDEYGTATGGGFYEENATAILTANANSGCKFVNWIKDGVEISTDNPYSFTVTKDLELVANFEEEVGIEQIEIPTIKVYPNPTTGELIIESGELRIDEFVIFDISGRKQKAENRKIEGATLIDISELPVGVYFLRITTDQGEVVRKVLKE
jgi:hypothetical protein